MLRLSAVEIILVVILMVTSVALFFKRFEHVLKNIKKAKPEPGYTIRPIARRITDFLWEVILQGKVIRQRPLPGLAHALVFWGFCAFALITLNHFASGFGFPFLSRDGVFGRFYFYLAAAFAVFVAVSIAGLAFVGNVKTNS